MEIGNGTYFILWKVSDYHEKNHIGVTRVSGISGAANWTSGRFKWLLTRSRSGWEALSAAEVPTLGGDSQYHHKRELNCDVRVKDFSVAGPWYSENFPNAGTPGIAGPKYRYVLNPVADRQSKVYVANCYDFYWMYICVRKATEKNCSPRLRKDPPIMCSIKSLPCKRPTVVRMSDLR